MAIEGHELQLVSSKAGFATPRNQDVGLPAKAGIRRRRLLLVGAYRANEVDPSYPARTPAIERSDGLHNILDKAPEKYKFVFEATALFDRAKGLLRPERRAVDILVAFLRDGVKPKE